MSIFYHLTHWPSFLSNRFWRFLCQKLTRGWSDKDTWTLEHEIAKFALPRLKRFKEVTNGYPGDLSEELWNEMLDKMIFSLEYITKEFDLELEDASIEQQRKDAEKVQEGLELFGKHFWHLWW